MAQPSRVPVSLDEYLKVAAHHRNAMVERRNIGLKITTGIVAFDLLMAKLAVDAIGHVGNRSSLVFTVCMVSLGGLIVLAGMLGQIEVRSRRDRIRARTAEARAAAILEGTDPLAINELEESIVLAFRQAWAASWPIVGVSVLTIGLWVFAGTLDH